MTSGKTTPGWPHWRRIRNEPCVIWSGWKVTLFAGSPHARKLTQSQIKFASVRDAATFTDSRSGTVSSVSSVQSGKECLAEIILRFREPRGWTVLNIRSPFMVGYPIAHPPFGGPRPCWGTVCLSRYRFRSKYLGCVFLCSVGVCWAMKGGVTD